MDSTKDTASGEPKNPQSVTTNAEDDPLLALADLFSGASLEGRKYVNVPMTLPLARQLHINQLNEYCLLALFGQFSLQRQLSLRAVCRQWQAIIEKTYRRTRSLKIFTSVKWYCEDLMSLKLQDDDQFKLKPVGSDDDLRCSFNRLLQCAHLFADITSFVCYEYSKANLDLIPVMFPKLTTLTLFRESGITYRSPFSILNLLPQLTSLHLLHFIHGTILSTEDLSMLRQLESFSFCNYKGPNTAYLLSHLGSNLTRLVLKNVHLSIAQLASVITANPSFATSITHLTIGNIKHYHEFGFAEVSYGESLLDIICSHMTNLVYLNFYCIKPNWFPSLAKLQHLTELHIDQFVVPNSVPRNLPPVSAVKQLYFTFRHIPTTAFNFWTLFPAVESIAVYMKYDNTLERAREYMSQFRFTCQVTFHLEKNYKCYMGRHGEASRA